MPRTKIFFICQSCGNESPRWVGRCPECNEWNTYAEKAISSASAAKKTSLSASTPVQELAHLSAASVPRLTLPMTEFHRVLGGGIVQGSVVLIGGDPGIGKSTLLLEVAGMAAERLGGGAYVSGAESVHQIKI